MKRIKSRTDVITNSSNETFITRHVPHGQYGFYDELTWERILNPDYEFEMDLLVHLVLNFGKIRELKENPFDPTWGEKPWREALDAWGEEELGNLWRTFVGINREAFEGILGFCYVYGRDDNEFSDYSEWERINDDLGYQSVMRAGRDCDFYY